MYEELKGENKRALNQEEGHVPLPNCLKKPSLW